ncbi:hypothetical protein O6H91_20G023000 [Diphasiastrum complanatum]|uniref:Uncharacterized protein n=2 Tax=Diphasiastrum complanatum TaxID=34168 RepID=A0ACC2ANX6_DIPCM|nr:hypothetical protein O6H91_20G023000 [Diphasiastrum complanatum]
MGLEAGSFSLTNACLTCLLTRIKPRESSPKRHALSPRHQHAELKALRAAGKRLRIVKCGASTEWAQAIHGIVLGVGVGLPCTVMECGDIVYRSTLPKSNALQLTPPGMLLTLLAVAYLWATPGVAPGFWDMFLLAPLEQLFRPSYNKEDFILGKKIGEGAFGTVYKASFASPQKAKIDALVVKKANEYGEVEAWMNERVRRACSTTCADYVHSFLESPRKGKKAEFWLVWRYEGEATLAELMASKEFPYNVGEMLNMGTLELPKGVEREIIIIRTIMRQILTALRGLHATGIVHRDIKPQNIIFSEESRRFKIIDLGAAADLRVGINYVPKEFLLDPRYAAPEQYIMSTQTPSAPPPPIAAALSPVLWQMNLPDRFDIYSAGLIFLQMIFPNMRTDSALIQFNRQLKRCGYDLPAWRTMAEGRGNADIRHGFEMLDMDGGMGWELLQTMIQYKGRQRISANNALAHPYFVRAGLLGTSSIQRLRLQLLRVSQQDRTQAFQWVFGLLARSGTKSAGGFTEAQLQNLKEIKSKEKATLQRNALASALRLQRKVVRTVDETIDELRGNKKKIFWWNRWQS